MQGRRFDRLVLCWIVTGACAGNGALVYAQGQELVYPDEKFLEYLASLEEVDGEWLGPEEMQYLQESEPHTVAPELPVAPDPSQPLPEQLLHVQEQKK